MHSLIPFSISNHFVTRATGGSYLLRGLILIVLALAGFVLSPEVLANDLGNGNTADGNRALINLTTGVNNSAFGFFALNRNTAGSHNTALGASALANSDPSVNDNTAIGTGALDGSKGNQNTAIGEDALVYNTTGIYNTADGWEALTNNNIGSSNAACGYRALYNNGANNNVAIGSGTLSNNTHGASNIAIGFSAGSFIYAGNNIAIGNAGFVNEARAIRIGTVGTQANTYIAGISGVTVPGGGVIVVVGADGHLGTLTSSARFKEAIQPMGDASEAIYALKPVTFCYKKELDPQGTPQFGLIAEQVEKVNPDLVARDADGKVYSVRYQAVNAMLLNEFLKHHGKVEAQEEALTQLTTGFAKQEQEIKALAANLQKVSKQVGADNSPPQVASNNQ